MAEKAKKPPKRALVSEPLMNKKKRTYSAKTYTWSRKSHHPKKFSYPRVCSWYLLNCISEFPDITYCLYSPLSKSEWLLKLSCVFPFVVYWGVGKQAEDLTLWILSIWIRGAIFKSDRRMRGWHMLSYCWRVIQKKRKCHSYLNVKLLWETWPGNESLNCGAKAHRSCEEWMIKLHDKSTHLLWEMND